ncbi:MAG TPA: hypothetical protein VGL80_21585 [Pseudonocardiaceae bacterium]
MTAGQLVGHPGQALVVAVRQVQLGHHAADLVDGEIRQRVTAPPVPHGAVRPDQVCRMVAVARVLDLLGERQVGQQRTATGGDDGQRFRFQPVAGEPRLAAAHQLAQERPATFGVHVVQQNHAVGRQITSPARSPVLVAQIGQKRVPQQFVDPLTVVLVVGIAGPAVQVDEHSRGVVGEATSPMAVPVQESAERDSIGLPGDYRGQPGNSASDHRSGGFLQRHTRRVVLLYETEDAGCGLNQNLLHSARAPLLVQPFFHLPAGLEVVLSRSRLIRITSRPVVNRGKRRVSRSAQRLLSSNASAVSSFG